SAHEWFLPAVIAVAVDWPVTTTGVDALVNVPFPNWPEPFKPQHFAVPLANNAHEWALPALIATALVPALKPFTATGFDALVVEPLPNWPEPLPPQHFTLPLANSEHE
ncbi:MAG: hypothetical protein M3Q30_16695, partial [Actinomycetota bacterium]|nr:hypothetical protein [Actinomycetota bacterium]